MVSISGCLILPLADGENMDGKEVREFNLLNNCWDDIAERISYGTDYIYIDDKYDDDDDDDFKEYVGNWILRNRPEIEYIEYEDINDRCYVDVRYHLNVDIETVRKFYKKGE